MHQPRLKLCLHCGQIGDLRLGARVLRCRQPIVQDGRRRPCQSRHIRPITIEELNELRRLERQDYERGLLELELSHATTAANHEARIRDLEELVQTLLQRR